MLPGSSNTYPCMTMNFSYGTPPTESEFTTSHYYSYYRPGSPKRFEIVEEPKYITQPLADRDSLTSKLFQVAPSAGGDAFAIPAERAQLQERQMHLLLEQLAARHSINYHIRKDLQYEECRIRSQLNDIRDRPIGMGREGRFESDLIKQIQQIRKEYHSESIACWRDTTRMLSDICDRWTEYSDESRKARMMDLDL